MSKRFLMVVVVLLLGALVMSLFSGSSGRVFAAGGENTRSSLLNDEDWKLVNLGYDHGEKIQLIQAIIVNKGLVRVAEAIEKLAENNGSK